MTVFLSMKSTNLWPAKRFETSAQRPERLHCIETKIQGRHMYLWDKSYLLIHCLTAVKSPWWRYAREKSNFDINNNIVRNAKNIFPKESNNFILFIYLFIFYK